MKKILITGSNGYIAGNIIKQYPQIEFGLCDYNTELPPAQELTQENVKDYSAIIHLAALSGIFACEENPLEAVRDNILAAQNIFKLAYENKIKVVFSSSQAAKEPCSSVYASMKFTSEQMANYYNEKGANIYVVRFANVYGGFEYLKKKQTCVKQLITRYKENKPFEIHGNGKQKRDFVHVYDIVNSIMKLLEIPLIYYKPIDIGTGKGISILELVEMFPDHPCEFVETRNAGADSSIANPTVLERLTGFKPERKLEEYIKGGI